MCHAAKRSAELRKEARRFRPGSPDWEYRRRAAWFLAQMADGIAACDWTEPPTDFLTKGGRDEHPV